MTEWPAAAVELIDIKRVIPYARNARTHSDQQIAQIAASMREFGWTIPILIDEEGGLIAGHGRISAARQRGYEKVPAMTARGWTEAQKRAYVLADNQLALNAGWDMEKLGVEVKDLAAMGFDLPLIGFDEKFLGGLLADQPNTVGDPEDVPDFPVVPTAKRGDVWILGKHRLVCGDSTQTEDVAKALNGVTPHLMVTDPPYGVVYDANWRNEADRANGKKTGARAVGKVSNDDRWDWKDAWDLFPGDVCYVWLAGRLAGRLAEKVAGSLEAAGFEIRAQIIWRKSNFAIGRGDYHWQHEPCWYAVRKGKVGHWNGDRKQSTVWDIDKPKKSETGHSTQKPIECMARPIRNNSSPGQAIYEPFCGSGTTLIACELEGRVCHAIEIEPKYIDVIIQRWQTTFDGEAVREADGAKYNHIAFAKAPGKQKPASAAPAKAEGAKSPAKIRKKPQKSTKTPNPAPHDPEEGRDGDARS